MHGVGRGKSAEMTSKPYLSPSIDLATEVVWEQGSKSITDVTYQKAIVKLKSCDTLINCLSQYGEINRANKALYEAAKALGLKITAPVQP